MIMEQKWDGFRAIVFAHPGHITIQSRNGADLTGAFPEIAAAAADLDKPLVLDGELVVLHQGCLHFGALQSRARRRGRSALDAAAALPASWYVLRQGAPHRWSVLKRRIHPGIPRQRPDTHYSNGTG